MKREQTTRGLIKQSLIFLSTLTLFSCLSLPQKESKETFKGEDCVAQFVGDNFPYLPDNKQYGEWIKDTKKFIKKSYRAFHPSRYNIVSDKLREIYKTKITLWLKKQRFESCSSSKKPMLDPVVMFTTYIGSNFFLVLYNKNLDIEIWSLKNPPLLFFTSFENAIYINIEHQRVITPIIPPDIYQRGNKIDPKDGSARQYLRGYVLGLKK